ncbi:hypothetical protein [Bifidobacterium mongoliense]|uniref:LPXTG-motif cell wall anchor domain-containing protein n=1 Tax=Bifidobacterium mongoliense DSM 21395 TaxID=1437603 RepID=A0A087C069_9BIFI|nr:hypothetical protein [Bifidobacterium mongoliense]KFI76669.1 LPXTG-motif cell wall anchor domain-containing protein [Bifidobacterium mongoliense DSM 21395]
MKAVLRNRVVALIALMAAVLMAVGSPVTAHAADLKLAEPDQYLTYRVDGEQLFIGVVAVDPRGSHYYCIEAGVPVDYVVTGTSSMDDTEDARRLAWLMEHYRESVDREAQAAIGVLTHDRYDQHPEVWRRHREVIVKAYPQLEARAQALWKEASDRLPVSAAASVRMVEGLRRGVVDIEVKEASGAPATGERYTVTLEGPAVFDNGQASISGASGTGVVSHAWRATGSGEVKATVTYLRQGLEHVASGQDFIRLSGGRQVGGRGVNFSVRKEFVPSLSTEVKPKVADAGGMVDDVVRSGVRGAEDHWVPDLELVASGWYFDRLDAAALSQPMAPLARESASQFLRRLQDHGHRPAAYGTARFTGPGQQAEVRAVTKPGGEPYRAPESSGFGTWVWAFERERQSERAKGFVTADVVTGFPDATETNTHRGPLHVTSTVTEHSATVGSELSDTVTVSGFPDDHGLFSGDEKFGFMADVPLAQMRVWWAGDEGDAAQNERYRPQGAEEPKEDEHHRLIGQWDYPAKNGVIKVGAGAKDAHGNPVSIKADRPGWYVFVWSFTGDDRVMPATSAYDDAWERTRVEQVVSPRAPSITTKVDPATVKVDEEFRDTAIVKGDLEDGAHVEFTAYEAVDKDETPGTGPKLLDRDRVAVDHKKAEQEVVSSKVKSSKPGLVYWKASVIGPHGDVLATHALGVPGEVVTVEEPAKPVLERPKLAHTGSAMTPLTVIGIAAVVTGGCMLAVIRRRSK